MLLLQIWKSFYRIELIIDNNATRNGTILYLKKTKKFSKSFCYQLLTFAYKKDKSFILCTYTTLVLLIRKRIDARS